MQIQMIRDNATKMIDLEKRVDKTDATLFPKDYRYGFNYNEKL